MEIKAKINKSVFALDGTKARVILGYSPSPDGSFVCDSNTQYDNILQGWTDYIQQADINMRRYLGDKLQKQGLNRYTGAAEPSDAEPLSGDCSCCQCDTCANIEVCTEAPQYNDATRPNPCVGCEPGKRYRPCEQQRCPKYISEEERLTLSKPYCTCPRCGAALDHGERCDCESTSNAAHDTEIGYRTAAAPQAAGREPNCVPAAKYLTV